MIRAMYIQITEVTHFLSALRLFAQSCNPYFFIIVIFLNGDIAYSMFKVVCSGKMTWAYMYVHYFAKICLLRFASKL